MAAPSNKEIYIALMTRLTAEVTGYPMSRPGGVAYDAGGNRVTGKFTPPDSGLWLEVEFQPNSDIDNTLGADDEVVPRGMMTVLAMGRPGAGGIIPVVDLAYAVVAAFPKCYQLVDLVRVSRKPYTILMPEEDDRLGVMVTVEYSG